MVRIVRRAVAAALATIVLTTWGVSAFAGDAEPVDDEELVDALIDAAAAESWPLDEDCVAGVVATSDAPYLDDELGRRQLLIQLASATDEEAAESSEPLIMIINNASGGFLEFAAPSIVDVDELRRQLMLCVAGSADQDLVNQAAGILAQSDADGFFDHQCVERVLSVFADDTLQLLIDAQTMTTLPADFEVTDELQSDLSRLLECRSEPTTATTDP